MPADATMLLSVGDGVTDDYLNLNDGINYSTLWNGFEALPPVVGARDREIKVVVEVLGATTDEVWANYRALQTKIQQARRAAASQPHGTGVTLSVSVGGSVPVTFDILDGEIGPNPEALGLLEFNMLQPVVILFKAQPFARGPRIDDAATVTITNGAAAYLYRPSVPGDVPAIARLTISDLSSSGAINRVRIGQWSEQSLALEDAPVPVPFEAGYAGEFIEDADAIAGGVARVNQQATWQPFAIARQPTPHCDALRGMFDVYARVRDSYANISTPTQAIALGDSPRPYYTLQTVAVAGADNGSQVKIDRAATSPNSTQVLLVGVAANNSALTYNYSHSTIPGWTRQELVGYTTGPNFQRDSCAVYTRTTSASESSQITVTISGFNLPGSHDALDFRMHAVYYEFKGIVALDDIITLDIDSSDSGTAMTSSASSRDEALEAIVWIYGRSGSSPSNSGMNGVVINNTVNYYIGHGYVDDAGDAASVAGSGLYGQGRHGIMLTFTVETTTAPSLPAGTYLFKHSVVSSDGLISIPGPSNAITLTDTSSIVLGIPTYPGTYDKYRIFWRRDSEAWKYLEVPAGTTWVVLSSESTPPTGGTIDTGSPPSIAPTVGKVRAKIGLTSGRTLWEGDPVQTILGGGQFEIVRLGSFPLPPVPKSEDGGQPGWSIVLESRNPAGQGYVDADCVWLVPFEKPQIEAAPIGGTLAAPRDWVIETNRAGQTFGVLYETGTNTDAGQLDTVGQMLVGPGDTLLVFIIERDGDLHDISATEFTLQLSLTPRYLYLTGES